MVFLNRFTRPCEGTGPANCRRFLDSHSRGNDIERPTSSCQTFFQLCKTPGPNNRGQGAKKKPPVEPERGYSQIQFSLCLKYPPVAQPGGEEDITRVSEIELENHTLRRNPYRYWQSSLLITSSAQVVFTLERFCGAHPRWESRSCVQVKLCDGARGFPHFPSRPCQQLTSLQVFSCVRRSASFSPDNLPDARGQISQRM